MKRILIVAALAVPAVVGLFGFPSEPIRVEKLVVTGSSTIAPLIAEIAKRFEQPAGARTATLASPRSRDSHP